MSDADEQVTTPDNEPDADDSDDDIDQDLLDSLTK